MKKSVYGGQALIEGLMIKGTKKTSIAIRKPNGDIQVKQVTFKTNPLLKKIPIIRGIVEFFRMNWQGIKALLYSAEMAVEEIEPSAFEGFLKKIFGKRLDEIIFGFTVIFSMLFGIALFILLPNFIVSLFGTHNCVLYNNALEGVLRLSIFTVYLMFTSGLGDMKRIWMYHGAEHKTIHCYEHEEILTVENVKKYSTKHPRCGTSFLFMVIIISIILFSFVGWHNIFINILIRLLLIPIVAGISYELFRLLWKSDNALVRIINMMGMAFQYFTTKEPDDGQIEVAITAFNAVMGWGEVESW